MKKIYFLLISIILTMPISLTSCNESDNEVENPVSYDQLPEDAKTFLDTYFYGYEVISVDMVTVEEHDIYQVKLQDNYQVEFNGEGEWLQVVAPYKESIPTGFIPPVIMQYLNYNYSGYGINQINKDGEGYKIELVTGLDLYFNMSGEVIDTSQNGYVG